MQVSRLHVTKSPVEVPHAVVAAGHPIDAAVGAEVLRRGSSLRRMEHRVVARTEGYSTFYFARPQVIQVGEDGLVTGVDLLRPATAMGF